MDKKEPYIKIYASDLHSAEGEISFVRKMLGSYTMDSDGTFWWFRDQNHTQVKFLAAAADEMPKEIKYSLPVIACFNGDDELLSATSGYTSMTAALSIREWVEPLIREQHCILQYYCSVAVTSPPENTAGQENTTVHDQTKSRPQAKKNNGNRLAILLAIASGAALCFCFHAQLARVVNSVLIRRQLPSLNNNNNNNVRPSDINYADPATKPLQGTKNFRCYVRPLDDN
jgi:hypothetical protein